MNKLLKAVTNKFLKAATTGLVFALLFCPNSASALETDFHGRLQSTYVLRDTNGFQYGFMDNVEGVQWRNELKFELTLRPEYEEAHFVRVEKIYLAYRGAYDAIFDLRQSAYENIREKSPDDFELGKDDLETENDLREAFIDIAAETEEQSFNLRLGRQIVQWGEADGFNVINIINPQDNSTMMFFENVDDLATPLWMARLNYSKADLGFLENFGVELVAIPDIRPHLFAPTDSPCDAPYAFWFKDLRAWTIPHPMFEISTDELSRLTQVLYGHPVEFKEDVPSSGLDNLEYGARVEGGFKGFDMALYYFHGFQDDPAMDFSRALTEGRYYFRHPEQDMYGVSFNKYLASVNGVIRGEGCMISKVGLVDLTGTNGTQLDTSSLNGNNNPFAIYDGTGATGYSLQRVYYSLIGFDYDRWIPWLNSGKNMSFSFQAYWRHIHKWGYDEQYRPLDKQDNYRLTGYFYTDYWHGRIHPELFVMYDPENTWMTMASAKYTRDGRWYCKLSVLGFWGESPGGGGSEGAMSFGNAVLGLPNEPDNPYTGDSISPFTTPSNLAHITEVSFRIGYNW